MSSIVKTMGWINLVREILIQCDTTIDLKLYIYIYRSVTHISRSIDFALYLEDCLMDKSHFGILDPCDAKIFHIKCMCVNDLHFMGQ